MTLSLEAAGIHHGARRCSSVAACGARQAAAALSDIGADPIPVDEDAEIEYSIAELARRPDSGLVVPHDPFLIGRRDFLIAQIARHGIPAVYALRIKGTNPGELPVQ